MASALLASRNEPHWGEGKVYMRKNPNFTSFSSSSLSNPNKKQQQIYDDHHLLPSTTPQHNHHVRYQQQQSNNFLPPDAPPPSISNDSSNRNPNPVKDRRDGGGVGFEELTKNGYVKFNISEYSKKELKDLKRRFVSELEQVRGLSSQIESRQISRSGGGGGFSSGGPGGSGSSNFSLPPTKKSGGGGLKRPFPFADTNRGPSMAESKLIGNAMKRCSTFLKNLMKHKHGYIFNEPVDPIKLMLHDYNSIIRNPMDLGTVNEKLGKGLYKTPLEFASDVRLTFNNALKYNPIGHEVHVLAKILLGQFNESFEPAYRKFESDMKKLENENGGSRSSSIVVPIGISDDERERERQGFVRQRVLPSSTPDRMKTVTPDRIMHKPPPFRGNSNTQSSKQLSLPPQPPPLALPPPPQQPVIPAAAATHPVYQQAVKQMSGGVGRPWSGKQPKPKAKDTNKRDMSTSEKEKLGDMLQNLPQDRMDQALQIIRKRNVELAQDGDEIELDIEAFDVETLWELDRFVGNYKKMLSKMRKQSLSGGNQNYPAVEENKSPVDVEMPEVAAIKNRKAENIGMEEDVDIGEDIPTSNFPPVEIEKDAGYASDNKSGGSSGSSSSDDSSSDSDSDSGSSSGSDSDGDEAQSPFNESKANKPNDGFD
ncbi:hypothetical protein MKX01_006984 [Papaver californicum]|nr:hypothetical protein MKX01_006984 [Papaver californicum]